MNQVILVGEVQGRADIIFNKKESDHKLMRLYVKVKRPFKNKEGEYDDDIIKVKVWTNNIDDVEVSLKDKSVIGIKGRISSFNISNDEENYINEVIADKITYLTTVKD